MNIRSVSVDILALLTCLGGSWSCGGNVDSSSESPRAIGAAHIETTRDGTDAEVASHFVGNFDGRSFRLILDYPYNIPLRHQAAFLS